MKSVKRYANGKRKDYDFYPTPSYVTHELLKRELFEGTILECACGKGDMINVIKQYYDSVDGIDIQTGCEIYGVGGVNFLNFNKKYDNIITNPPFNLALEFVLHAKQLAKLKIAFLLNINFLEGQKRYEQIYTDNEFKLKKVIIFSKRINFTGKSNITTQGWFIWDRDYDGKTYLEWIK